MLIASLGNFQYPPYGKRTCAPVKKLYSVEVAFKNVANGNNGFKLSQIAPVNVFYVIVYWAGKRVRGYGL